MNLKIYFCDFWDNFQQTDNYFYHLLSMKYDVEIDDKNPDIVFYSLFGSENKKYNKDAFIKVFYTGENRRPDFNECNYSISFDYLDDNHNLRLPLWVLHFNWFKRPYIESRDHAYLHDTKSFLEKNINLENKNKFCSFIASNPNSSKRIDFAIKLNRYKKVDSPGRVLNNIPNLPGRGDQIYKILFLNDYKFNISFENSSYDGYCTEKIVHSMFSNCIPIYYGDKMVFKDFNPKSFLNLHNYESDEHLINDIIEIDNNIVKYKQILEEPWFENNIFPERYLPENVITFFEKIINDDVR